MTPYTIAAILLVAAGILGLVYGGFSYTKDSQEAKLGPFELTIRDKQTVNIPVWAGVASILLGAGMFAYPLIKH